ncbi:mismatch-specific DNA-glycosylase [Pseudorhodobacter ferrugineus]|uniref:mismatch-specific DNA-glycosylase n=1 Tax=Pseudorhodobacter ferrugineus TaxID=77008 RepID=UPI0003B42574|nr:mismatch-specific DNA-glycosylase [Pseudorhodobacter ferrugineus]
MLSDRLAHGLEVVFCGTAASHASAAMGHYYAGPGNRFWPLLAETGLTPRRFAPSEDHLLLSLGIGLTDLAKDVCGMDRDIPKAAYAPDRLAAVIAEFRPKRLAFTSLTAAKIGLGIRCPAGRAEAPRFPDLAVWVLPSPSGAARATFDAAPWHDLGNHVRGAL